MTSKQKKLISEIPALTRLSLWDLIQLTSQCSWDKGGYKIYRSILMIVEYQSVILRMLDKKEISKEDARWLYLD